MEASLPQTHFEPASGALIFTLAITFVIINVVTAYSAASCGMAKKPCPGISMSKMEFLKLVRIVVREETEPLKQRMAVREWQAAEAIEMAHINEVRITALEDEYNKAMKEMGALQSSLDAYTSTAPESRSRPAFSLTPSPSISSSRAPSHSRHGSLDSVYGAESSSLRVSSSHDRASEVISPQLDKEAEDELVASGGWSLDQETGDMYEARPPASAPVSPPQSSISAAMGFGRTPFSPLTACSSRNGRPRPE